MKEVPEREPAASALAPTASVETEEARAERRRTTPAYTRAPKKLESAIWRLPISRTQRALLSRLLHNAFDVDHKSYRSQSGAWQLDGSNFVPASYGDMQQWVAGLAKETAATFAKEVAPAYVKVYRPVGRQRTVFEFDEEAARRIMSGHKPGAGDCTNHRYGERAQLCQSARTVVGTGTVPITSTVLVPATGTVDSRQCRPGRHNASSKNMKKYKGADQDKDVDREGSREEASCAKSNQDQPGVRLQTLTYPGGNHPEAITHGPVGSNERLPEYPAMDAGGRAWGQANPTRATVWRTRFALAPMKAIRS